MSRKIDLESFDRLVPDPNRVRLHLLPRRAQPSLDPVVAQRERDRAR